MASPERNTTTVVKDDLYLNWYNYSFYSAVDLLEKISPEKKKLGQSLAPAKEAVRFSVRPGFTFPPSEIAKLEPGDEGGPAKMDISFLGLVGPSGVLPHWYNELAIERLSKKDSSLTAFLDIFHHRLISLFYLAWKKHQFPVNFEPGARDKLSGYLLSLCGLGLSSLGGKIGLPEESLSYYSGLLSRQVPSASSIRATVEHFSGAPAEIQQFIDRLIPLDKEDQSSLGGNNNSLGTDTVCGEHVWDCQTKFRLDVGPMKFKDFSRFVPSGDLHEPIFSLVRYMVGIEYEFDISFYIEREEVPDCVLGQPGPGAPRLGWSSWLKSPDFLHEEDPYVTFHEILEFV